MSRLGGSGCWSTFWVRGIRRSTSAPVEVELVQQAGSRATSVASVATQTRPLFGLTEREVIPPPPSEHLPLDAQRS